MRPALELLAQLAAAAVIAVLVGVLDGPLAGVQVPWMLCALVGLTVVFGGVLLIRSTDDW